MAGMIESTTVSSTSGADILIVIPDADLLPKGTTET